MKPFERLSRREIFKGKILSLVLDEVALPNGKTALHEVVLHNGASAVLPVDEDGRLIFVRQYRYAVSEYSLEIPAGRLEAGEDPLECAKRELEEETAYKSDDLTLMTELYSAIGFSNEKIYVYLAKNLKSGRLKLDDDEFIDLEKYTPEQAVLKIRAGEIRDAKTIAAVLMYRPEAGV